MLLVLTLPIGASLAQEFLRFRIPVQDPAIQNTAFHVQLGGEHSSYQNQCQDIMAWMWREDATLACSFTAHCFLFV